MLISLLSLWAGVSFAQQATQGLSLSEAIKYALEHKADAKKAQIEVEKASYKVKEVRASAFPQISANAGLTHNPKLQATYIDGSTFGAPGVLKMEMGQKWTGNASLGLSQVIFNQAVFMGLKAARTTHEFYELNAELTENDVIEKVARAYYQAHQAQVAYANVQENFTLIEKNAEIVKNLYQAGLVKKIDVDRVAVALSNLASAKQQALNGVQLTQNALKFMVGIPMETQVELAPENFQVNYEEVFSNNEAAERTELKVLEKQKTLLELNVKANKAGFYPSLSLSANYGYLSMGPKNPLFYGKKDNVYGSDFSAVGLNLHVPIFAGFATKAKVQQAQAELKAIDLTLENTKLALSMEQSNARSELTNSFLSYEIQKENVGLAQDVLTNTQNNYLQGLASLTELLDAERSLLEAKNNQTNAIISYKLAEVALLKAQGKLRELQTQ